MTKELEKKRDKLMRELNLNYSAGCHWLRGFDTAVRILGEEEEELRRREAEDYERSPFEDYTRKQTEND